MTVWLCNALVFDGLSEQAEVLSLREPKPPAKIATIYSLDSHKNPMYSHIIYAINHKLNTYSSAPYMDDDEVDQIAQSVMWGWHEFGIPPSLTLSIMEQESGFNYKAVSDVGAMGLMQVMPRYSKKARQELGIRGDVCKILYTPHLNVRIGITMLNNFFIAVSDRGYCSKNVALTAYNAGESNAFKFYRERDTKAKSKYARLVLKHINWYRSAGIL